MNFWKKLFREKEPAQPNKTDVSGLSPDTQQRLQLLFPPEEQPLVESLLIHECGNNLPFLEDESPRSLERFRYAALKLSDGNLEKLHEALKLAQQDWRDLLVAAGFADDVQEHQRWMPEQKRQTPQ